MDIDTTINKRAELSPQPLDRKKANNMQKKTTKPFHLEKLTAEQFEVLRTKAATQGEVVIWKGIRSGYNTVESLANLIRWTPERFKSWFTNNPELYKENEGRFELVLRF